MRKIFKSGDWWSAVAAGTDEENLKYCSKSRTSKPGTFFEVGVRKSSRKSTRLTKLRMLIDEGGSYRDCWKYDFETMVKHYRGIKEGIAVLRRPVDTADYELKDFPWEPITDWTKSHIFWGKSGIGKSQFAKAHFKNPLMVSHKDHLMAFDAKEHDGIIFDDMNFQGDSEGKGAMFAEAQIHLVDQDDNRQIHVRFHYAEIPKNTKKIFTTNRDQGAIFDLTFDAVIRRLIVHELKGWREEPENFVLVPPFNGVITF